MFTKVWGFFFEGNKGYQMQGQTPHISHLFRYCPFLFSSYTSELSVCNRNFMANEAINVHIWPLHPPALGYL